VKCPKCQFDNTLDSEFCRKCGSQLSLGAEVQFSKTMTLDAVQKILSNGSLFAGRYRILGVLGQGGMGIVYQAEDTKLKRTVALKFLPAELSRYPEAKERFIREAQAAAVLDHPNICTVHEVEESDGVTYIAMAYLEGQSLRDMILKRPLAPDQAVDIAVQVAEALEAAHRRGIVHRDIKSANIMVKPDGQARIMDFGLAKMAGESVLTRESKTMGTVAYMSPEQARGEETDHRTDIWSLGVVLYEILTGELPFRGERETSIMYSIVHEEPRPMAKLKAGIPIELIKIVERAMKKDREARYAAAAEMARDLRKYQEAVKAEAAGLFNMCSLLRKLRRPQVAIPLVLVLIALAALAVVSFNHRAKIRWARNTVLPKLERLVMTANPLPPATFEALRLFDEASKYLPDDPKVKKTRPLCVAEVIVETEPPQARVFVKEYTRPESEWRPIGLSPIVRVRLPNGGLRWRIEKDGYEAVEFVAASESLYDSEKDVYTPRTIKRILEKTGAVPPGMVRVEGGNFPAGRFEDFFIDRYEVTNIEYKEFVEGGGYGRREFWTHPFIKEGKPLSWETAMALFKDSTGRPGPAAWVAGTFPEGQADYPVAGVSWYEAAAFAEFKKKSLPLIAHWSIALGKEAVHQPPLVLERPFLNIEANGPLPVGATKGLNQNGVYDLRGNVSEWLVNDCREGKGIAGGAWNSSIYQMAISYLPPFERSPRVGFRCVLGPDPKSIPSAALDPYMLPPPPRDFYKETPVSDAIFEVYKEQFSYDKTDLQAKVEKRDDSLPDWTEEKVSFAAAYGGERVGGMLLLPKRASPPFPCVIFFLGSAVLRMNSIESFVGEEGSKDIADPLIANGCALLFPVYKGTFERGDPKVYWSIHTGNDTRASMEYWIQLVKDFRRSVDYLETRPDIAADRIVYWGASWGGGGIAPVILSVETRLKAAIMVMAGLPSTKKLRPEVDPINYISRVKVPTLIFSGKYDLKFPYETSAKPFFDLLGTPKEHKFHKVYPGDHFVNDVDYLRDTLDFLDKYLGPVK
jgi:serine/threonine protein kinase/formylglycine-generating enzyme required for sulfatase activity/dienelactone hydrolase